MMGLLGCIPTVIPWEVQEIQIESVPISIATICWDHDSMMWYICVRMKKKNPPKTNLKAMLLCDTLQMRISRGFFVAESHQGHHHRFTRRWDWLKFPGTWWCLRPRLRSHRLLLSEAPCFWKSGIVGVGNKKQSSNPCISWNEETLVSHFKTLVL